MKKLLSLILVFALSFVATIPINAQSQDVLSSTEIEELAIKFATTSFSDFADPEEYCDEFIDQNAINLINFISDKREMNTFKQNLLGRELTLISKDIIDCKLNNTDDSLVQVLLKIHYTYIDGDIEANLTPNYKIYIDKVKGTVVAAMTNDLSAGSLIPAEMFNNAENLNAEYQLVSENALSSEAVNINKPYNLKGIENNIADFVEEMKNENVVSIEKEQTLEVSPMSTFVSFSSNDRANMRKYQDKYFNTFNPNYANFTNDGGDCTNYASQVLNASSAPQYISSSSGITGSSYWYYKNSSNRSSSWTGVNQLRTFLLNNKTKGPSGSISSTFAALDSGDIIQLGSNDDYYHSIVVYKQGGDPWVTTHTVSYSGYYSSRFSGLSNSKIHISGYYK